VSLRKRREPLIAGAVVMWPLRVSKYRGVGYVSPGSDSGYGVIPTYFLVQLEAGVLYDTFISPLINTR
jgi:hypothetical protein